MELRVVIALLVVGCRSPAGDANTPSTTGAASAASASVVGSASSAALVPPILPYAFDRGCAGDIDKQLAPEEQLDELGRMCAPGQKGADAWSGSVQANAVQQRGVEIEKHACIRIGIASPTPGAVLRIVVRGPRGRELAMAKPSHTPMLLPPAGPVCTEEEGKHVVEVSSMGPPALIHARIWRSDAPAAPAEVD